MPSPGYSLKQTVPEVHSMPDTELSQSPSLSLLVVDDDQDIRDLMADYLRQHGFQVRVADGGKAMFEILEQDRPDLVVLDIMMPGEDGLSLCRRMRAAEGLSSIPVIFLTALGDTADRVVGLELGADDYVVKPFQPRELLARIRAVLRRSGRSAEVSSEMGRPEKAYHFSGWTLDISARHLIAPGGMVVNLSGAEYRLLTIFSTLFFTCLIPGGLIFWMKKTGYISSLTLDERKQRTVPYLLSAISFIAWASFLMEKLHAPHYLVAVAIGAAVALLLVLLVNLRWKISAHLTGWGGFMGGFFGICFQYGINPVSLLILLCLIAGLLIWARLYLPCSDKIKKIS